MRPSFSAIWNWTYKSARHTGAQANTDLWDPAADKQVFVHKIIVSRPSAAMDVQVTVGNDAAATRLLDVKLAADTGTAIIEFPFEAPLALGVDAVLKITTDTGNVSTVVYGNEV